MSNKKATWSLQNDVRSEEEQNVFTPTGKRPENKILSYIIWSFVVVLISSFTLTFLQEEAKEICFTPNLCFNSKDNVLTYTFYVFLNIIIVVLAIIGAYIIGKKLGNLLKR